MMIGIDGEWGLFQRFPRINSLGYDFKAIQDNSLIYEMTSKIAEIVKEWAFIGISEVVDVNTNPAKPYYWQQKFWVRHQ